MSELDLDAVRRLWDENADDWAAGVRGHADVFRDHYNNPAFLRLLGDVRGARMLDAGCGEGTNTRLLRELGAHVVGVDISERMIEHARRAEAERPLGIEYAIASFTDLHAFPDEAFDVVVSTMALMDAPDLNGALREFARVLRRGGRVLFSVTHPCFTNAVAGWEPGDAPILRLAGYASAPVVESWRFRAGNPEAKPFRIAVFPRTIAEIVSAVIRAGLVLAALEEPVATDEAAAAYPALIKHRVFPHFLHVAAVRPA